MNSNTGEIHQFDNEEQLKKVQATLGDALVKIDKKDMTEKQRKEMKVSKHDSRSKLGLLRRKTIKKIGRNNPCPCGSNKKYKKCCLNGK